MSSVGNPADCLDRARMHDLLADSTEDGAARAMHRAMAAEFRRRAAEHDGMVMPPVQGSGPLLEMQVEAC